MLLRLRWLLLSSLAGCLALASTVAAADDEAAAPLRLATFNIHHAEGDDGKLDLERVAAVVRGADIVAFQEVDVRFRNRSAGQDQADLLGKALKGHVAFGPNLVEGDGQYGVALVSKYPIVSSRNHRLPRSAGREAAEPRGLLETVLDVRGRRLRVYVTHLAHDSRDDRRLQVDAVRSIIEAGAAVGPAILMGDLNFRPNDPSYAALLAPPREAEKALLVDAWPQVGKGDGPTIGLGGRSPARIDYILVTPDLAPGLESARVDTETRASDHQPVFATLRLPEAR